MHKVPLQETRRGLPIPTLEEMAHASTPLELGDISRLLEKRGKESRRYPDRLIRSLEGQTILSGLLGRQWQVIALGDDAIVLGHHQADIVLRFAQNWEAYGRFVRMAVEANNPHFPRFLGWQTYADFSLAAVEYLKHLTADFANWADVNLAASLAHAFADSRPVDHSLYAQLSPELVSAAVALGEGADEHYYALDLGIENLLLRPATNEIIFNDPWSQWGD